MGERGAIELVQHGGVAVRFAEPIAYELRPGAVEGTFVAVLVEPRLAGRIRERINHGRGTTPAGAVKSLERRLLKLALSPRCPRLLAALVAEVGPREHSGRPPVTEMLKLAVLAQWLCVEERRGRVFAEVCLRQEPTAAPASHLPHWRLDLVLLEPGGPGRPPRVTGVELKSSRADFTADHKWTNYIGRVDRLYLATVPGAVKPEEVPDGVGLLELRRAPDRSGYFDLRAPAADEALDELARLDLYYALATCDRLAAAAGLELSVQADRAVAEYWAGRSAAKRRAMTP